ncbi:LysR family transcriptional regulator [Anaeromicrobium sediminis]|uniref:HTH lysR-type domain-containing protein n=1 Tax=Anaeromicrobium sediminis TaxID=1478221 RepID=A0A267MIK4_9FIRM|nr:LysR family transcriptional regulator [Anaeromicrobium sediminis]PAB59277.1 hypothetical protein CCE28_10450 [Anaeromicrobium sediminis]
MNINYDYYKIFYHVAKNLSFSKSANELYISQSAVSQSIKTLEDKLGISLFLRHKRKITLTKEGEKLFEYIKPAIENIISGENLVKSIKTLESGQITIGVSDTLCRYYLLDCLKTFNNLYPHIKIKIINKPSPKTIELALLGECDFSIVNLTESTYIDLTIHIIKESKLTFIASHKFEHLKDISLSLEDLIKYPILMLSKNSTTRKVFNKYLEKSNLHITPELESESMGLLVDLCKIGLGISLVSEDSILKEKKEEIFMLDIKETLPQISIALVHNKNIPLSHSANTFLDLIKRNYNTR